MRGTRRLHGVVWMALACAGCGPAEREDRGDPLAQPPVVVSGPDLRIGSPDDAAYAFRAVMRVGEGPDGSVYSLHLGEATVRRWTSDGRPDGEIGRAGDGPGEFQRPGEFGFFGDSMWVSDRFRHHYFGVDGSYLGTATPEAPSDGVTRASRPFRDRTYFGRGLVSVQPVMSGELTETPVLWLNGAGEVLGRMEPHPHSPNDLVRLDVEGGFPFAPQLISDAPFIESGDTSVVRVDRFPWDGESEPELVVRRVARTGDTLSITAIPYEPIPLDDDRFDALVEERVEEMWELMQTVRGTLTREGLKLAYVENTHRPEYVPPIEAMVVADDGSVWLQPVVIDSEPVWWVLNAEMRPVGRVATPRGFRLMAVHEDRLWGVERDDLDVEYIVRYRFDSFLR